jgi:hypothetical protein
MCQQTQPRTSAREGLEGRRRRESFSRTCWITFHCSGTNSSVSVTSSPIFRSCRPEDSRNSRSLGAPEKSRVLSTTNVGNPQTLRCSASATTCVNFRRPSPQCARSSKSAPFCLSFYQHAANGGQISDLQVSAPAAFVELIGETAPSRRLNRMMS